MSTSVTHQGQTLGARLPSEDRRRQRLHRDRTTARPNGIRSAPCRQASNPPPGCLDCADTGDHSPTKTRHTTAATANNATPTRSCGHSVHNSATNRNTRPSAAGTTASHLRFRIWSPSFGCRATYCAMPACPAPATPPRQKTPGCDTQDESSPAKDWYPPRWLVVPRTGPAPRRAGQRHPNTIIPGVPTGLERPRGRTAGCSSNAHHRIQRSVERVGL